MNSISVGIVKNSSSVVVDGGIESVSDDDGGGKSNSITPNTTASASSAAAMPDRVDISRRSVSFGTLQSNNSTHSNSNSNGNGGGGPSRRLDSITAYTPTERQNARAFALKEAMDVLQSEGGSMADVLDSFNLLGVVANPRSGAAAALWTSTHGRSSRHGQQPTQSQQQQQQQQQTDDAADAHASDTAAPAAAAAAPDFGIDLSAVESTLSGVTETIDSINVMVDQFSRHYLSAYYPEDALDGGYYYYGDGSSVTATAVEFESELRYDDTPTVQLLQLPYELRELDMTPVEQYLKKSSGLSQRFQMRDGESQRVLFNATDDDLTPHQSASTHQHQHHHQQQQPPSDSIDYPTQQVDQMLANVPEIFFTPYFDLTDAATFETLLLSPDPPSSSTTTTTTTTDMDNPNNPNIPTNPNNDSHSSSTLNTSAKTSFSTTNTNTPAPSNPSLIEPLLSIQKPETLTSHLDTVELTLLNQVRSKSNSFFRETDRFTQLKRLVAESVTEVRDLRHTFALIKDRTVTDVELIPLMDRKRHELRILGTVLDQVSDILQVKESVPGLIAAGDYLGAVEAIRSARQRLTTAAHSSTTTTSALGKLTALSKINYQLTEYEDIIVLDLGNELTATFLTWGLSSSSSSVLNGLSATPSSSSTTTTTTASSSSTTTTTTTTTTATVVSSSKRTRVREVVKALRACRKLDSCAHKYRENLCDAIRVTVRTTVNECAVDAAIDFKSTTPSKQQSQPQRRTPSSSSSSSSEDHRFSSQQKSSITTGVTSMTSEQFLDCLELLFEQLLTLLRSAVGVAKFCREEGIELRDDDDDDDDTLKKDTTDEGRKEQKMGDHHLMMTPTMTDSTLDNKNGQQQSQQQQQQSALAAASELSHKSVSELLRLRKEANSLASFDEMKRLWDSCLNFTLQSEKFSGQKAYGLRSTLLSQAKAFVERKHEGNMSGLVAALDSERWTQCDISSERQASLTRLCSGRAVLSLTTSGKKAGNSTNGPSSSASPTSSSPTAAADKQQQQQQQPLTDAEVDGKQYKAVWSCLLLVEMVMSNVACAAHFQTLATNVVGKVSELLRLFNSRTTQLVLGAGAIHSAARLKSINAKHLALVTQCLGLIMGILPHVRAALMAQLPSKQHTLLSDLDKIKKEYMEHNEKVLSKFVSIIGGIVEHGLAPKVNKINFDERAKTAASVLLPNPYPKDMIISCCPFLEAISSNVKKMHQVLNVLLPQEDMKDVFSRIFAYVDQKVPCIFMTKKKTTTPITDETQSTTTPPTTTTTTTTTMMTSGSFFSMPITEQGKFRMLAEIDSMCQNLNGLQNVRRWDFTSTYVLERELGMELRPSISKKEEQNGNDKKEEEEGTEEEEEEEKAMTTTTEKDDDSTDNKNTKKKEEKNDNNLLLSSSKQQQQQNEKMNDNRKNDNIIISTNNVDSKILSSMNDNNNTTTTKASF